MSTRRPQAFDTFRAAREDTLALVAGLDQAALDVVPEPGRWSVGEILDHLVRADEMFLSEIRGLVAKQRRGRTPFTYRGLRDLGAPGGSLPFPFRLPIEGTLAFWNVVIPPVLREWAIGQRQLRAQAPEVLVPRAGRARDALFADLRASVEEAEALRDDPDVDLDVAIYYSPVVGFSNVPSLIRIVARHDRRHQDQIREAVEALGGTAR